MNSTITAADIHVHGWEGVAGTHLCHTCCTSADDCSAMTVADAEALIGEGYNLDAMRAWCEMTGEAFAHDSRHDFDDAHCGEYDSFREYADAMAEELLDCEGLDSDSMARRYFDFDGFARDLLIGGDYFTTPTDDFGVRVFRSY